MDVGQEIFAFLSTTRSLAELAMISELELAVVIKRAKIFRSYPIDWLPVGYQITYSQLMGTAELLHIGINRIDFLRFSKNASFFSFQQFPSKYAIFGHF